MSTTNLHAHVSVESADCDGRYSSAYTLTADEGQDDYDFKVATTGNALGHLEDGSTASFNEFGFDFYRPTEEGFVSSEIRWCDDGDADRPNTQRDHSAEAAGY